MNIRAIFVGIYLGLWMALIVAQLPAIVVLTTPGIPDWVRTYWWGVVSALIALGVLTVLVRLGRRYRRAFAWGGLFIFFLVLGIMTLAHYGFSCSCARSGQRRATCLRLAGGHSGRD
jgi:hypothetical protein